VVDSAPGECLSAAMRPRRALLALTATLALVLPACDTGEGVPEAGGGAAGGGEGGTLVAAISSEPDQLDPHNTTAYASFQVLENVFDTLVQPTPELEFEPALAESWETSDDQLTWTFELRDDVTWHNGRAFSAEDVVYSFTRIIDEELSNAYRFTSVVEVRAVDDDTVEFLLDQPTPNLLANVGSYKGVAVVARENVEDGSIGSQPVGTGPFRFESLTPGQGAVLSRNDEYWGGDVALGGVEYRFIPESVAALTSLRSGEVHWTDNVPPQQVQTLLDDDTLVAESVPSNDYWYIAPNHTRPPFDDERVRRALALGIDREAVTRAAQFDAATPNQTAIPQGRPFSVDYAPYERDVAEARRLLEEAGAVGTTVDLMVTSEFPETVTAAEVVAGQLAEVGLTVQPRVLGFGQWLAEQGEGSFDMFLLGWLANIDPDDYYYAQHHSTGANNFQGYSNPEVDAALDAGRQATEDAEREQFYDTAVRRIVDDVSYLYLYNPDVVQAWRPEVTGYTVHPNRAIRWRDVSLDG